MLLGYEYHGNALKGQAIVDMPLEHGVYGSVLAAAAAKGNIEIVKFLVQEGRADVNMPLEHGIFGSALAAAAAGRDFEIVEFLVQKGANRCAEVLINAGANVNLKLENGPFRTALQASRADAYQNLQASQADAHEKVQEGTSLIMKEEDLKRRKARVAELLQYHGATDEV
ncbi:hypothetical protein V8E51_017685 [Hyaloscypha variabilis]